MRGKKLNITKEEILSYMENHTMKQCADYFNIPLTTLASRLEKYDCYPFRKATHIDLTEENIEYIKTHYLYESSKHFQMYIGSLRNFVNLNHLEYKRRNFRNPPDITKRIERYNRFVQMHKSMTFKEIADKEGITVARVSQIIRHGV